LVVTELVSNAIRHGLPPYQLELRSIAGAIRVEVFDGLPLRSQPRTPTEPGGFGLDIVNACASQWGADALLTGKIIWVEIKG
jgi:two-component sensor histidine kinase